MTIKSSAFSALIFDRDSHFGKTGDRGETVCALQEAVDFGQSVRKSAEHDAAVGDGLVARDRDLAPDVICFA